MLAADLILDGPQFFDQIIPTRFSASLILWLGWILGLGLRQPSNPNEFRKLCYKLEGSGFLFCAYVLKIIGNPTNDISQLFLPSKIFPRLPSNSSYFTCRAHWKLLKKQERLTAGWFVRTGGTAEMKRFEDQNESTQ